MSPSTDTSDSYVNLLDFVFRKSRSQLGQDIFVLQSENFKRDGYFIEFGATDGVDLSNTWLLEKEFSWKGILAEPAKIWQQALQENRTCNIDTRCVWASSGEQLVFNEPEWATLSTIEEFTETDNWGHKRVDGNRYLVDTISLEDLLIFHNAPKIIDYLSIDTEGSEYKILSNFNFDNYIINIITCEHNYMPIRENIYDLLTLKGYERVYPELSQWDDWYVRKEAYSIAV